MAAFEFDEAAFAQALDRIQGALVVTAADIRVAVTGMVTTMVTRTLAGQSIGGAPFAGYAPATQRSRSARGRTTGPVTLSDTGAMLAAIQQRIEGDRAVIFFSSRSAGERARYLHEGTSRMPARPWFGFSAAEELDAAELIARRIARRIEDV